MKNQNSNAHVVQELSLIVNVTYARQEKPYAPVALGAYDLGVVARCRAREYSWGPGIRDGGTNAEECRCSPRCPSSRV